MHQNEIRILSIDVMFWKCRAPSGSLSSSGRTSGSRSRKRTKSHFQYKTTKENKQKIAELLIPAHFDVRFSMDLLKFHVKIKREFFFWKNFFSKKFFVCIFAPEAACCEQIFFSCLYLARARARARARAPSCKHGGALGALPKNKSKFQPFRARGWGQYSKKFEPLAVRFLLRDALRELIGWITGWKFNIYWFRFVRSSRARGFGFGFVSSVRRARGLAFS